MDLAETRLPVQQPLSVVLVEDDQALLGALAFALRIEGYEIYPYSSAEELLAEGLPSGPVCLVIDQGLPGMTGLDLVEILREQGTTTPAILITGRLKREVELRVARVFQAVVNKPLLGNSLTEAISKALS